MAVEAHAVYFAWILSQTINDQSSQRKPPVLAPLTIIITTASAAAFCLFASSVTGYGLNRFVVQVSHRV